MWSTKMEKPKNRDQKFWNNSSNWILRWKCYVLLSNCNDLLSHVLTAHLQVTDRLFGSLSKNHSDPICKQPSYHLHGFFAASNEFGITFRIWNHSLYLVIGEFFIEFQRSDEFSTVLLLQSILFYGFWAFGMVYFACELGQRLSIAYDDVENKVSKLDWYLLPMETQRMLPTLMCNTQKPFKVVCFGGISCERDTFKTVRPWKWK